MKALEYEFFMESLEYENECEAVNEGIAGFLSGLGEKIKGKLVKIIGGVDKYVKKKIGPVKFFNKYMDNVKPGKTPKLKNKFEEKLLDTSNSVVETLENVKAELDNASGGDGEAYASIVLDKIIRDQKKMMGSEFAEKMKREKDISKETADEIKNHYQERKKLLDKLLKIQAKELEESIKQKTGVDVNLTGEIFEDGEAEDSKSGKDESSSLKKKMYVSEFNKAKAAADKFIILLQLALESRWLKQPIEYDDLENNEMIKDVVKRDLNAAKMDKKLKKDLKELHEKEETRQEAEEKLRDMKNEVVKYPREEGKTPVKWKITDLDEENDKVTLKRKGKDGGVEEKSVGYVELWSELKRRQEEEVG